MAKLCFQPNKPLFSLHYLENRIQEHAEWQEDGSKIFAQLKALYEQNQPRLPTLNEAQTKKDWIQPILARLGFVYIVQTASAQTTTRREGRTARLDYALFTTNEQRSEAYLLQGDETAFYSRVSAIAEAKYWACPLCQVSKNDPRDTFENDNPTFQIVNHLAETGVDWGILTNGREWRLHYRQASSIATEFYAIDLVNLLESGDLEQFKYFWCFFRRQAFELDAQEHNFLKRVREGSISYAQRVENQLRSLILDPVFKHLVEGFVTDAARQHRSVTPKQVYEATLSFLYKILFLLYAEARNLLPSDRAEYWDHCSLTKKLKEIAQKIDCQQPFSRKSTSIYDDLLDLFRIIHEGDLELGVPRYTGSLFHFRFQQDSDRAKYPANYFLTQNRLTDAVLAPMLDSLSRIDKERIDYSFMDVRHLGAIYEGLLEYQVVIVGAGLSKISEGEQAFGQNPPLQNILVHLEKNKGDRKATGSYYTPGYIVKYIILETLKPILAERQQQFQVLMGQIATLQKQQDQRLGTESLNGLTQDLKRLHQQATAALLDIKICDPAMGSGHFLVAAVDFLTDEVIRILTQYPNQNPVLDLLEEIRQGILSNLQQQGIIIDPKRLEDQQLLQRLMMKRCIYGVDLNPMAVELAKVSLWLHSFTIGAPLSFLDHHLRCGNSLIGTTARQAEQEMSLPDDGEQALLRGPFAGLLAAAKTMEGISNSSDTTISEAATSETLFQGFIQLAEPFKSLLNICVSQYFGIKGVKNFLEQYGADAINVIRAIHSADAAILHQAEKVGQEKCFFHWDLEFPEVFVDLENLSWKENPGFDAVVGNPPYLDSEEMTRSQPDIRNFISQVWQSASGNWDLFVIFVEAGIRFSKINGFSSLIVPNKLLGAEYAKKIQSIIREKRLKKLRDYSKVKVFDSDVYPIVYVISNQPSEGDEEIELSQILENKETGLVFESRRFISRMEILDKLSEGYWWPLFSSFFEVIEKVLLCSNPLEDVAKVQAAAATSEAYEIANFVREADHLNQETIPEQLRLINTGTIDRYESLWGIDRIKYLKSAYYKPVVLIPELANISVSRMVQARTPKIILAGMTLNLEAYYDSEGIYLAGKSTVTICGEDYSNQYLLSIINSRLCSFVYQETFGSLALQGGYLTVGLPQALKLLIPKVAFTTPADRRQQALQHAIALYNQFQTDHNANPLLIQVKHYLNQEPAQTDVMHDLLAYLAQQMIDLNQQKQVERKGFLTWLERFIGTPIDSLTNKSRLQNYSGDRQSEQNLSFDHLIELLKKNKKKLKIDLTGHKEQTQLETEYRSTLETLLPIKTQLTISDRLIDAIVYQMYGLTEAEIAIVERK